MLKQLALQALDWVLPPSCLHCDIDLASGQGGGLCPDCFEVLQPHTGVQCHRCGTRVDALFAHPTLTCGGCLASPPAFDRVYAPFVYAGPARTAILKLKYHNHPGATAFLARAMAGQMPQGEFILLPVPLHRRRLRSRGFNQSVNLARHIQRLHKNRTAMVLNVARRIKATPSQGVHSPRRRLRNVAGAFQIAQPMRIRGQHVLIIDDVVTTGATCRALAKQITKAGAASVSVLAAARALPK